MPAISKSHIPVLFLSWYTTWPDRLAMLRITKDILQQYEKMKSQAQEKYDIGRSTEKGKVVNKRGQTWPLAQVLPMCRTVSSATESGKIPAHSMVTTEYSSIPVRIKHHWLKHACPSSEVSSNPHWMTSSHPP
jgi:hypothetical protein